MKQYLFLGSSILSFAHNGKTYVLHGKGPFLLPENAKNVEALIQKKLLVEVPNQKTKSKKIK